MSFVTGRGEWIEKTIAWKIEDVADFLKMSNMELVENGIAFDAGYFTLNNGSQVSAAWKYHFGHIKEDEENKWIGGFLKHEPCAVKSVKYWYSVSLSSGGKLITSFTAECNETSVFWLQNKKLITKAELLGKTEGEALEVNLHVKVLKPVQKFPSSNSVVRLKGQMSLDLVKMLESGDGANVEIKVPLEVGGELDESSYIRKAHKGILMARSSVFATMLAKESTMLEAQTGKVVIKDLSPKGLNIFLHYLYTGKVLEGWVQVVPELNE